jgi:hypothetical protein
MTGTGEVVIGGEERIGRSRRDDGEQDMVAVGCVHQTTSLKRLTSDGNGGGM